MLIPSTPPLTQARILYVDDETTARTAVTRALKLMGYRADGASSGKEALDRLSAGPFDLMLLDLRMPGIDGTEVVKRAHKAFPDLLVLILTAHATVETAVAAVRLGAADYLIKPCSIREIEATIARVLERRREVLRRRQLIPVMVDAVATLRAGEPGDEPPQPAAERFLRCGPVTLDRDKRMALVAGTTGRAGGGVELTANEDALLAYLMAHPDTVFSCHQLARDTLDYDVSDAEAEEIVRPHISRLRKNLEPDPRRPTLIRTLRGKGYLFAPS